MGRTADTLKILADGDSQTYTVKRITQVYSTGTALPYETASAVDTATGLSFDSSGRVIRDARGEIIAVDRTIFFMPTTSVAVRDRLYRAGQTNYDEVLSVIRFSDHLEILTREVDGR